MPQAGDRRHETRRQILLSTFTTIVGPDALRHSIDPHSIVSPFLLRCYGAGGPPCSVLRCRVPPVTVFHEKTACTQSW